MLDQVGGVKLRGPAEGRASRALCIPAPAAFEKPCCSARGGGGLQEGTAGHVWSFTPPAIYRGGAGAHRTHACV